ncbi:MAG: SusD/RagB family nutrient-binding outer membrane lipoprotein [Ekhidna sp.]|uniref:SusD/RagB family nutrient-binding outer membrane lipoprotein n=1 Tax=Ekhidna sp. TaxID=2608089 RepID=UPI0032ED377C
MNRYIKFLFAGVLAFSAMSCKDFLDINEDPNSPTTAPLRGLLPETQIALTGQIGMAGLSGYTANLVGHYTTRGNLSDYGLTGNDFSVTTNWNNIYARTLQDLKEMDALAQIEGEVQYRAVGRILKAYAYSVLVDLWGDVPLRDANLGGANTEPRYDDGAAIYDTCFINLDLAIAALETDPTSTMASDDLFFGGDVSLWIQAAKTLKLRLVTQARLANNPTNYLASFNPATDLLATDWELQYGTSINPDNRNPLYIGEWAPAGSARNIDPFFYEVMTGQNSFFPNEATPYTDAIIGVNDPRVRYYWYNQLGPGDTPENPVAYLNGFFLSIYGFSFNIDPNEGFDQGSSRTLSGLYPGGGAYDNGSGVNGNFNGPGDTPQRLLTRYNAYFNLSELALNGTTYGGGDARSYFEDGVREAFAKVNAYASAAGAPLIAGATIDSYVTDVLGYYDAAANNNERLEIIMIEKWKANFGLDIVAYNDYRRTGFPRLHDGDTDILPQTDRQRNYPVSLPYNTNSLQINGNAPAQRVIANDKVFWDN